MRNRNRGALDITGVYDVTCKESFNNVSVQTMGSTSMFLTVSTSFSLENQEELPTEETTTEPASEPPVEITKNESADQAEDGGTAEEKEAESTEPVGVQERDDKSIASKSVFGCC